MQTKEQKKAHTRERYRSDPAFNERQRRAQAERRLDPEKAAKDRESLCRYILRDTKLTRFKRKEAWSRKVGIPFDLEFSEIVWPEYCPVLDIKLDYSLLTGKARSVDSSPSFDRIDPTKGYVKGNVLIVSNRANKIKHNATPEELRKVAKFYTDLATPAPLEAQKRATSNVIPGAVLANLLAEEPGFVEDVQGPDDDFGGISRDTIEFSHD